MNTDTLKFVYFSHEGRINRVAYWIYSLPLGFFGILIRLNENRINEHVFIFLLVLLIYPALNLNIKRCHDRGKSGYFIIFFLIPILCLWPMIELYFLKGNIAQNKFGSECNLFCRDQQK